MITREDVKDSLEYKWRGSQWKVYLVLMLAMMVLSPALGFLTGMTVEDLKQSVGVVAAGYAVLLLPFAVYPMWRQWQMLHRAEHYQRYQVKLCNPLTSWAYKHSVYYRVVFKTADGENVVRNTKPMFSGRGLATVQLEEYNNKTVDVFYDKEKDLMILAGNPR